MIQLQLFPGVDHSLMTPAPRIARRIFPGQSWPFPPMADRGEEWRRCQSWPLTWASSWGRIAVQRTLFDAPRIVARRRDHSGYLAVTLGGSVVQLHRLVADAWHGPKPAGLQVRHLDGDKLNNTPGNLAYGTARDNWDDAARHGVRERKLSADDVRRILLAMYRGETAAGLAPRFNVSVAMVAHVMCGEQHAHIAPHYWRRGQWSRHRRRFRDPHRAQLRALERIAAAIQTGATSSPAAPPAGAS